MVVEFAAKYQFNLCQVVNLVEAPVPILGEFNESFLELPEDLLTMVSLVILGSASKCLSWLLLLVLWEYYLAKLRTSVCIGSQTSLQLWSYIGFSGIFSHPFKVKRAVGWGLQWTVRSGLIFQ